MTSSRTPSSGEEPLQNTPLAAQAAASRPRADVVDIVRGFAVLGILFVNITTFRSTQSGWTGLDQGVDLLTAILAQGKFVTVFMILFGLSFSFQAEDADKPGFARRYARRIGGLLLLGVLHFVLLWEGDILMQYVMPGLLLLFFARRQPRTIALSAAAMYGLLGAFMLTVVVATAAQRAGQPPTSEDPSLPVLLYQTGSYGALLAARLKLLPQFLGDHAISSVLQLGTFLLGAYIGRRGLLSRPGDHKKLLWAVFLGGLAAGLPASAAANLGLPYRNSASLAAQLVIYASALFGPIILALGYIAGVALLAQSARWLRPLAAAGRMSLSNYLMQSLVLSTVFYAYGLALYDKIHPAAGLALVLALYGLQVLLSNIWMKSFRYGPVEWAWRCLTYWRREPMRRKVTTGPG